MNARPASRVGEVLEAVPGLIVTQHSGEGKANQYFLRGFNLDHGTDIGINLDGMPINSRTHAHGQGYSDLNFMIPELVDNLLWFARGRTGPTRAISLPRARCTSHMPTGWRRIWSPGTPAAASAVWRGLAAGSMLFGNGSLLAAGAEIERYNGPWDVPDGVRKYNGVLRYGRGTKERRPGDYRHGLCQHVARDQPYRHACGGCQCLVDRFGTLDPSDAGTSSRFCAVGQLGAVERLRPDQASSAYVIRSSLQLFNDFTYFLDDPVNGDQFSQTDRRTVDGLDASHAFDYPLRRHRYPDTRRRADPLATTSMSACSRRSQRETLSTVREDQRQGRQRRRCAAEHRRRDGPTGCAPRSAFARTIFAGRRRQRHAAEFRQRRRRR